MAVERHIVSYGKEIETLATIDISTMWNRMLGEFLNEWTNVNRQNLPLEEVERAMTAYLDNLSPKFEEKLAKQSASVAYNQGRSAEIKSAFENDEAEFVVRSEILDENTCSECEKWDGLIVEIGSPSYDEYMPPAKCLGGTLCRGFYVAVPSEVGS